MVRLVKPGSSVARRYRLELGFFQDWPGVFVEEIRPVLLKPAQREQKEIRETVLQCPIQCLLRLLSSFKIGADHTLPEVGIPLIGSLVDGLLQICKSNIQITFLQSMRYSTTDSGYIMLGIG